MINIIHVNTHFDDNREITALEVKLKYIEEDGERQNQYLIAIVCKAYYNTTLLPDVTEKLNISTNPKRTEIVNLSIKLKENNMAITDIADSISALQRTLDETSSL